MKSAFLLSKGLLCLYDKLDPVSKVTGIPGWYWILGIKRNDTGGFGLVNWNSELKSGLGQTPFFKKDCHYTQKKHRILDHVFIKKEFPYNYNENKHKIHFSDREINTIRTVLVTTFLGIKWIHYGFLLHKLFAPLEFCSSVSW